MLITIVLIQFLIIGYFVYTDNFSTVTPSSDVVAVVAEKNNHYLLMQKMSDPLVFELPDNIHYVNKRNNYVYLFDKNKNYVSTYYFNSSKTEYTEFFDQDVYYEETEFKCERQVCMIKSYDSYQERTEVQVFTANNENFIYLDADALH